MPQFTFKLRTTAVLSFIALVLVVADVARAEWYGDADFSVVYDDNVSRGLDKEDRKADFSAGPRISLGHYAQLADSMGLAVIVDARETVYARFYGLDNLAAGLTVSLKYKPGMGTYAPWFKVYGSTAYVDYRESFRTGPLYKAGLVARKRAHERVFLQIAYEYEQGRARNSLFDARSSGVSLKAEFLLTETAQVSLGYAVRKRACAVYEGADPASGEFVVNTFQTPMEPYQVHAEDHTLSIGVNKVLDRRWSSDFIAERHDIRAEGNRYPDVLYRADVRYAY